MPMVLAIAANMETSTSLTVKISDTQMRRFWLIKNLTTIPARLINKANKCGGHMPSGNKISSSSQEDGFCRSS